VSQTSKIEIPSALIDAINGLADAAFLVADDGVILAVNSAAAKMFDYSESQLVGSQVDELMPSAAREYHHGVRTGAVADRRPRHFTSGATFECERRGGDRFHADIMLSPTEIDSVPMTWAVVRDLDRPSPMDEGRRQALDTLDAIGYMTASTFDLSNDFSKVADRIKEIIPHDRMSVMLIYEEDPKMVEVAFLSGEVQSGYEQGALVPLVDSATSWVVKSRSVTSFTAKNARFSPPGMQAGFKQGLIEGFGVPLFDGDDVIGMLGLGTRNPQGFSEFQRGLIERMARHLSVAVMNQRMRARLHSQSDQLKAIGEIARVVSSTTDLNSAFTSVSALIARQVSYDRLSVYSVNLDLGLITGIFSGGEKLPGFDKTIHQLPDKGVQSFKELFSSGKPTVFDREVIAKTAESQASFVPYRDAGYNWTLVVPLAVSQHPVGFIAFARKAKVGFSDREITIASQIGDQLAGSVSNAFQRSRLTKEFEVDATLIEIGRIIGSTLDLKSSKDQLGPLIRSLVDSNSMIVSSITEDGRHLRINFIDYASVVHESDFSEGSVHPIKGTTAEKILQTRRPIIVNVESGAEFISKFPGAGPAHATDGLVSVMNIPLITNDAIFGFLTFRSVIPQFYLDATVEIAEKIGAQLASSVAFSELRLRDVFLEKERSVLASIGALMGASIDLSEVWSQFAEKLTEILSFDYISLAKIDRVAGQMESLYYWWSTEEQRFGRSPGDVYSIKDTLAEELISTNHGLLFSFDSSTSWKSRYPGSHPTSNDNPVRSVLGIPLVWGGETVAVMFIHSLKVNGFSPINLRLAERVATYLAGPVAGSILRRREVEVATENEILTRIGSVMGSVIDIDDAWPTVIDLIDELVECHRINLVSINHSSSKATVIYDSWNYGDYAQLSRLGITYDLTGSLAGRVVETTTGLIVNTESTNKLREQFSGSLNLDGNISTESNMGIPLIWGGDVVAVLFIGHFVAGNYDQQNLRLAERVATYLAGPVAGSILRRREAELANENEILARIGLEMGAALDLADAWPGVVELVGKLIKFDRLSLVSIDHEHETGTFIFDSLEQDDPYVEGFLGMSYKLGGTMTEALVTSRRGLATGDETSDQRIQKYPGVIHNSLIEPDAFPSLLMIPLIWGGKVVAVLSIGDHGFGKYHESDLILGNQIASQIAGSVAGNILRMQDAEFAFEQEILSKIGSEMGAVIDLNDAWPTVGELIGNLIEFDRINLSTIDQESATATIVFDSWQNDHRTDMSRLGGHYSLSESVTGVVVETATGLVTNVETTEELLEKYPGALTYDRNLSSKSNISVPLKWGGNVVAVLFIGHQQIGIYDENDLAIGVRIAAQIAGSVSGSILRTAENAIAQEHEVLAKIGTVMSAALELDAVWDEFSDLVSTLLGFDRLYLVSIDEITQTAAVLHDRWFIKPIIEFSSNGESYDLKGTVAGHVAHVNLSVEYSFEYPDEVRAKFPGAFNLSVQYPFMSNMAVPLSWGGRVVAVLFFCDLDSRQYGGKTVKLAERITSQIAGPVAGSLLREREVIILRERSMLVRILEYVGAAESFGEVFDDFASDIGQFLYFDAIGFIEIDHARKIIQPSLINYREGAEKSYDTSSTVIPLAGTMTEQVVNTSRTVSFSYSDVAEIRAKYPGSTMTGQDIPRSSLTVPIRSSDRVEACLWFSRIDGSDYSKDEIEFAERIASQIAGPVARTLIRKKITSLARERTGLANIGELMIGAPDIGSVFAEFLSQMRELLRFDALTFMEINHARKVVERRHIFLDPEVDHKYAFQPRTFQLEGTIAQKVASTKVGVLQRTDTNGKTKSNTKPRSMTATPYVPRSSIMVPLLWGDEVVMTLWVARDSEEMFDSEDFSLMVRIASQIAGPVAGTVMNRRELDVEDERRRREIAELKVTALSELSETKSNFVSAMSHELRTPLTSIVAFADILTRNPQTEFADRDIKQIKVIQRNARRLEGMINELLDLSRMESGKFEIFRASFDFVSMIAECLESAEPQFQALSQTIHCEMLDEVLPVNGDRGRLLQVVNNLLNNASKFSPKGTDINLTVIESNEWLTVEVRDQGPGIFEEKPDQLFEMFYRTDNELTRRVPGTGIGLHISKRIVDEHGGEIKLSNRKDRSGTVVSFSIPMVANFSN